MRYPCLCILPVSLLFVAASECAAQGGDIPEVQVVGTWKWLSTTIGPRKAHSPKTDGYTAVLRFKENGEFEFYRDGKKQVSGHYTLGRTEGARMVEFDKGFHFVKKYAYIYRQEDTLTLDGSYEADAHESSYTKVPDSDPLPMDQP